MPKTLLQYIETIPERNRTACIQMFNDHEDRFLQSPGSKVKHQAWPGGYIGHLEETMSIAKDLYEILSRDDVLPFSIADAILVLYLHDLEKPFKYIQPKTSFLNDAAKESFIGDMIARYGITLTADHQNALKYIHGEGYDHNSNDRIQGPLAAFVHCCDTISARIRFDFPKH